MINYFCEKTFLRFAIVKSSNLSSQWKTSFNEKIFHCQCHSSFNRAPSRLCDKIHIKSHQMMLKERINFPSQSVSICVKSSFLKISQNPSTAHENFPQLISIKCFKPFLCILCGKKGEESDRKRDWEE